MWLTCCACGRCETARTLTGGAPCRTRTPGERHGFANLQALFDFLRARTEGASDLTAKRAEGAKEGKKDI